MFHAFGPAQVANVNQTVDTVLNLDERAEVGQVSHAAFNRSADWVFVMQCVPRIRGKLPHSQRDSSFLRNHVEHYAFDLITDVNQLRRMLHTLRPRHLADVDESFDTLLQLYERTVVGNADDSSRDMRAHGITMRSIQPRIRSELLES